jgi:hypothetical protein
VSELSSRIVRTDRRQRVFLRAKKNGGMAHPGRPIRLKVVHAFDDMDDAVKRRPFDTQADDGETRLIRAPRKKLKPNTWYELVQKTLTHRRKRTWRTAVLASWKTSAALDRQAPRWHGAPYLVYRSKFSEFGDCPTAVATVSGETGPLVFIVTVQPARRGKSHRAIVVFDPKRDSFPPYLYHETPKGQVCQSVTLGATAKLAGKLVFFKVTAADLAGNKAQAPGFPLAAVWEKDLTFALCLKKPTKQEKRQKSPRPSVVP